MRLTISTPTEIVASVDDAASIRAEDATGWFGILPDHADFLTALSISVVSWHTSDRREGHCAVRAGVLTVLGGDVAIATREAVVSDDLERLEHEVLARFRANLDEELAARTGAARLHLAAVQRLMGYLRPQPSENGLAPLAGMRHHVGSD